MSESFPRALIQLSLRVSSKQCEVSVLGKLSGAFSRSLSQCRVVRDGLLPGQLVQLADEALLTPHALQPQQNLAAPIALMNMLADLSSKHWHWTT